MPKLFSASTHDTAKLRKPKLWIRHRTPHLRMIFCSNPYQCVIPSGPCSIQLFPHTGARCIRLSLPFSGVPVLLSSVVISPDPEPVTQSSSSHCVLGVTLGVVVGGLVGGTYTGVIRSSPIHKQQ